MKFWKPLPSGMIAMMLCLSVFTFSTSGSVAHAQNRTLPDFTDLVEQVGPSVVNIRTIERAVARSANGGESPDEEMQELFRRFSACPCRANPMARANNGPTVPRKKKSAPAVWARASF